MYVYFDGSAKGRRSMDQIPRIGDNVYLGSVHRVTDVIWLLDGKDPEVMITLADLALIEQKG